MEYRYATKLFDKIPEGKQSKVMEAAIAEFAAHGFESANINTIAQSAEISIGSLYKYFTNKEQLYLAIVHYCVEKLRSLLEEVLNSEGSLEHRIEGIIHAIQLHARENESLNRIYNQMTTVGQSALVMELVSSMEGVTAGLYAEFIEKAKAQGEVRAEVDAGMYAFFLDNLFLQLHFSYSCEYYKERMKLFMGPVGFEDDERVAAQLMMFIRGALFLK